MATIETITKQILPFEGFSPVAIVRYTYIGTVKSFTDPDCTYTIRRVHLKGGNVHWRCSCPDFQRRQSYCDRVSPGNLAKYCKHLAYLMDGAKHIRAHGGRCRSDRVWLTKEGENILGVKMTG